MDSRSTLYCVVQCTARFAGPATRIILTHTYDEVHALNLAARKRLQAHDELGEDALVRTERGERAFASGDRVMFLKNERGLGVKNGTLGNVQFVTQARMALLLGSGRSVDFDLKDYAHVDHGHAATVHKSQSVCRWRPFAGDAGVGSSRRLCRAVATPRQRRLSRERSKDMASDYGQAPEPARAAPAPARGMFDGLDLRPRTPAPTPSRGMFDGLQLNAAPIAGRERTPLEKAVERYARAAADIFRMRRANLADLPHQKIAFADAARAIEAIRPDAARDLRAALSADPALVEQAASGKTAAAIRAMNLEAEIRTDTMRRADRFVADWQYKTRQLETLGRSGDYDAVYRVKESMTEMAHSFRRDPQLESLLRNRARELGIGKLSGASLSHDLLDSPALSRGRGLGL